MKQMNILKRTAATLAIIGTGTFLFNGLTETVMAARPGLVETVPTSYQVSDSLAAPLPVAETKQESNEEVNYYVSMDSLNKGTPTEMDLTMEEAAKVGEQYLKNILDLDCKGGLCFI